MKGYKTSLQEEAETNDNFRKVLYTSSQMQLVLMSLKPEEEIGLETHMENDQFFRFESGEGKVVINKEEYLVKDGDAVMIPMGATHNVMNLSKTSDLKLYSLYSPPHHKDQLVRKTRLQANVEKEAFDGETTEKL